jgi:hypothetical protein
LKPGIRNHQVAASAEDENGQIPERRELQCIHDLDFILCLDENPR